MRDFWACAFEQAGFTKMALGIQLLLIVIGICSRLVLSETTSSPLCANLNLDNGQVQCDRNGTNVSCTGVCKAGLIFATGTKEITKTCNDTTGVWDGLEQFPKCVANTCMSKLVATVNDSAITASSQWSMLRSYKFGPERGRLNSQVEVIGSYVYSAGWKAGTNHVNEYIQVELQNVTRITGVVTQGRSVLEGDTANEYVTQYRVLYSLDGTQWLPYSSLTVNDLFLSGNVDKDTPRANILSCSFDAKFVRINPLAWHENIAMRFELLGCEPDGTKPSCRSPSSTAQPIVTPTPGTQTTPAPAMETTTTVKPDNLCSAIPPPTNGNINCELQKDNLVCVANCVDGYIFESNDLLIKRECDQETGIWSSSSLPRCISNVHATPLPPTHNYTHGCVTLKKDCDQTGNGDYQACGGCHFFASCSEGYLYVRACPEALLFDAISGVCDYHSRSCPA